MMWKNVSSTQLNNSSDFASILKFYTCQKCSSKKNQIKKARFQTCKFKFKQNHKKIIYEIFQKNAKFYNNNNNYKNDH